MSVGNLIAISVLAVCVAAALLPSRRRDSSPTSAQFWLAYAVNELPIQAGAWLMIAVAIAALDGDLTIAVLSSIGLGLIWRRALRARATLRAAHIAAFGRPPTRPLARRWTRWPRIVLWPFPWIVRSPLRRIRDISYGPAKEHRLDVYVPRQRQACGPVLIHLHGGAFRGGRKNLDAQPVVNRLVAHGWVCVSANYRLSPHAVFPDQLVDVKHVIAWVRANAEHYGADPSRVVIAGSSAGGHLAATAALIGGDPRFQPGFEEADTTVRAAICLYPYPGAIETRGPASSPLDYLTADAPPMFVAAGTHDTLVVPADSRAFVERLCATSRQPVLAAELPGAHHCFDLFHSIRCESVIDAVHAFTEVLVGSDPSPA